LINSAYSARTHLTLVARLRLGPTRRGIPAQIDADGTVGLPNPEATGVLQRNSRGSGLRLVAP
jgi:hypothetical protein